MSSTLARETLALSQALAGGGVPSPEVRRRGGTRQAQFAGPGRCAGLAQVTSQSHIVDAKSLYDVLSKGIQRVLDKIEGASSRWRSWPTPWPRLAPPSDGCRILRRRAHQRQVVQDQRVSGALDQDVSLHSGAGTGNVEAAVGTTCRLEKEAADDSPEDSADAMVAVECARQTCPLTLEEQRMAGIKRLMADNSNKTKRSNAQLRPSLNWREARLSDSALSNQRRR